MIKFAIVSHILPPSWSGQAVVIRRLLNTVPPEQYCLISREDYSNSAKKGQYIGELPGRYYHLPQGGQIPGDIRFPMVRRANILMSILVRGWHIAAILKREHCAAVVVGTGDVVDPPAAYLASRLTGIAFYLHLFDDYTYQWTDAVNREMARWFESLMFKQVSGVIVPNEFLREEIRRRHGLVAHIVRNPCEVVDIDLDHAHLAPEADEKQIVFTGAIYHANLGALRRVVAAIELLGLPTVRLHLYTAQSSELLAREKICGEHVVYHRHVPPDQVVEAQNSASILLVPFTLDSIIPEVVKTSAPGKFGDYLASGTPILAFVPADSYVGWYLREYNCGLVVDRDDPLALAEAIRRLVQDQELRKTLGRNARLRAKTDFTAEQARGALLQLLEQAR
jgi:glycosyltransferase involved in cell wall biosynthesis